MKKMKVTTLFHWLYASLMLAPVFAVASAVIISAFNCNTSVDVDITYKYETNDVNTIDDLKIGNIYTFEFKASNPYPTDYFDCTYIKYKWYDEMEASVNDLIDNTSFIRFSVQSNNINNSAIYYRNDTTNFNYYSMRLIDQDITFVYLKNFNEDYIQYVKRCDDVPIASVRYDNLSSNDVIYCAIDKVVASPLFGWAGNSFIVEPFHYIGDLFGVPADNPLYVFTSYWLDISLIWLVFDVLMYVPLLAHRWLDEGGIH